MTHATSSNMPAAGEERTVAQFFWARAQERGARVAMREKQFGVWEAISWSEYAERAKYVALGFKSLGLQRGDVVSVMADNCPEWLYVDMGVQGVGGIVNGVYTTDSAKQIKYIVNDSSTKFFCAGNEEFLDKALEVRADCPSLQKVIVFDMEGLHHFSDPMVLSLQDLIALGRDYETRNPGAWESELSLGQPEDIAILVYTSGTTGPSKGAMLSNANLLFIARSGVYGFADAGPDDEILSFLPLCHIAERNWTTLIPLGTSATVNFAENMESVPQNICELQPTLFVAVPRIWEKFYSTIAIRVKEATSLQRWIYEWALACGYRKVDAQMSGRPAAILDSLTYALAHQFILRNLKRMIGMDRMRFCLTGAAPISPDLIRWYRALGVQMVEAFGMTETSGITTVPPQGALKLGTVGKALPGTQIRIGDHGEILVKGPHVFAGYLGQPEKTRETIRDAWLHSGDVGRIDDEGYLTITDRMKDIIITAGGKNISPSEIENQLKFSPYISDAIVIGDRRKFLTCLIMIDHDNVVKFAQDKDVPFSNFASLCRAQAIVELICEEIEKVNAQFARVETIKAFRLIDQMLTPEDDELTPTMKLKRKFVNEKYRDIIADMYAAAK